MAVAHVTVMLEIDQERLLKALLAAVTPLATATIKFGPVSEKQETQS